MWPVVVRAGKEGQGDASSVVRTLEVALHLCERGKDRGARGPWKGSGAEVLSTLPPRAAALRAQGVRLWRRGAGAGAARPGRAGGAAGDRRSAGRPGHLPPVPGGGPDRPGRDGEG